MCNAINQFVQDKVCPLAEAAVQQIQYAHGKVLEGALWLGREIHNLTHQLLPRQAAIIAEAAIKSFPFFVVRAFLPVSTLFAAVAGVIIYKMITVPKEEKITSPEFENGMGFGGMWIGGRDIVEGLTGKGVASVAWGVLNVAFSMLFFSRSGLQADLDGSTGSAPQPLPVPA